MDSSLRSTHFGLRDDTPTGNSKLGFLSSFSSMVRNFLSCDWGTSHLRLRLVETATLRVLAEMKTGDGASSIRLARRQNEEPDFHTLLACARQLLGNPEPDPRHASSLEWLHRASVGWSSLGWDISLEDLSIMEVFYGFVLRSSEFLMEEREKHRNATKSSFPSI